MIIAKCGATGVLGVPQRPRFDWRTTRHVDFPMRQLGPWVAPGVRARMPRFGQDSIARVGSDLLGYQIDGAAGAFLYAESTALAVVIVKAIAVTICNLADCVVRAHAEAVVALEAIAA